MATQTRTLRKGCLLGWMQKPAAGGISREGRGHRGNDGTPGAGGTTLPGSISRSRAAFGRPVAVGPASLCSAVDSGGAERARQGTSPGASAGAACASHAPRAGTHRVATPELCVGDTRSSGGDGNWVLAKGGGRPLRRGAEDAGCLASPRQPRTSPASQALCGLGLSVWGESCDRWNEGAGRACPGR